MRSRCSRAIDYHWRRSAFSVRDEITLQLARCARLRPRRLRRGARVDRRCSGCASTSTSASRYVARHVVHARAGSCRCRRASSWRSACTAACGASRASPTCSASCSSAGLGAMLIPLVLVMLQLQTVVPRSVLVLYPIVLIFLMAGQPLRLPHLEGAPALQPARGAGRAGARRRAPARRARGSPRNWRAAGSGASSACSTTILRSSGRHAAQRQRARADRGPCRAGRDATACAR